MNANLPKFIVRVFLLASLVYAATSDASAQNSVDSGDVFHRWVDDPLFAAPSDSGQRQALPGDISNSPCPAEIDMKSPLSLTDAVDLALCTNPRLRNTWAQIKVQAAKVGQARAAYLPTMSIQLSKLKNRTTYPNSAIASNDTLGHTTYASLNWLLLDFGGRTANLASADAALQAAIEAHDAEMQKMLGELITDYYNAITAKARFLASVEATNLAQQTVSSAQRRLQRGVGNRSDFEQAQIALEKSELTLSRDVGDFEKAQAALRFSLGLKPDGKMVLPDLSAPKNTEAVSALTKWIDLAERSQPAIREMREQVAAARARIESARSDGMPSLSFTTTFDQNGYPNQGLQIIRTNVTTFGLTLNIPVFDGFLQHYKINEARAQEESAEAQMQDTEHRILQQVVSAYSDAVTSLSLLDVSEKLLASSLEAMKSAQNRYDHGVGSMIELLSVQSSLTDARQQRVLSIAHWDADRLKLLAASGILGHEAINRQSDQNEKPADKLP